MDSIVDCRGLACPQPVIRTKQAMAQSDQVTTIVDNETAVQNVARMAEKEGYAVAVEKKEDGIYLSLSRAGRAQIDVVAAESMPERALGPIVLLIPSDGMGRGDEELGGILIRSFLHTLNEVVPLPDTIIFLNAGVKLTVAGSPVLEDLETLTQRGVEILACGTCLGHFGLKDKVAVGEVSNMYSIAEALLGAGKVVGL
jgi:selenium metabolism protein YedF